MRISDHVTKPYEFIRFGAIDVTKPYEFIGFGAIDVTKPYEFIRFGAIDVTQVRISDPDARIQTYPRAATPREAQPATLRIS